MTEQEIRAQASINELAAINALITQRCINGASESAVLKAQIAEYAEKFAALQKEVESLKAEKP